MATKSALIAGKIEIFAGAAGLPAQVFQR